MKRRIRETLCEAHELLDYLYRHYRRQSALSAVWTMQIDATVVTFTGEWKMNLKDDARPIAIGVGNWVDKRGKRAKVDPNVPVTFTSSDPNLVEITTNAAGLPAIKPGVLDGVDANEDGVIGDPVVITAKADADLGDGTQEVTAVGSVIVTSGQAATGEIVFGAEDPAP